MFWRTNMIIKLQEVMRAYRRRADEKMTYDILSQRTGMPTERVRSIGARRGYNATLDDLNLICVELGTHAGDLLEVDVAAAAKHRAKLRKKKTKASKPARAKRKTASKKRKPAKSKNR